MSSPDASSISQELILMSLNPMLTTVLESDTDISETTTETQKVFRKPYCTSAKLKIPTRSPFHIHSMEDEENAKTMDDSFAETFDKKCVIATPVVEEFKKPFPVDLWRNILDCIHTQRDLASLCRTSSIFYILTIPYLYRTISIRPPLYYGEKVANQHNIIPLDILLSPVIPVNADSSYKIGPPLGIKRRRICKDDKPKWDYRGHIHPGRHGVKLSQKWELLRYVKDLRVEKWEGLRHAPPELNFSVLDQTTRSQSIYQTRYGPEGVRDLSWAREGVPALLLSNILADLLKDLITLESFCYNPQRYNSVYTKIPYQVLQLTQANQLNQPNRSIQRNPRKVRINGIKPAVFDALKALPNLKSLTINFQDWDPLNERDSKIHSVIQLSRGYNPESTGLIGFKNLEELVVLGVSADRRFSEIEIVVKDCIFSTSSKRNLGRKLKRLEVRVEERWHQHLQENNRINLSQDLWDWATCLWGEFFGKSESFRCAHGLDGVDIDFLLEFGPIKWQWQCPRFTGFVCRSENLTALNLQGVHEKQILGAIERLAKLGPCLKFFAVECRLIELNMLLKRFSGLRELYVFEPCAAESMLEEERIPQSTCEENFLPHSGAFGPGPIDIKGIHWVLDTICKCHLRTLEVLVIQEVICPPRSNCRSGTINSITGWKERGTNLRELGVRVWGPWEEIGGFLTAFEHLKALHLFNHHRCGLWTLARDLPIYKQIKGPITGCKSFYNPMTTAVRIANLWGRDLIYAKGSMKPVMLDEDRWIGVGHCIRPWKWNINDAAKYINWEDFETRLWPKFSDCTDPKRRVWEEGGRMWKVLRQGGILTHCSNEMEEEYNIGGKCCSGCSIDMACLLEVRKLQ